MIVNLHIERLVLDGLPLAAGEGPLVGAAVEAELIRLLSADGAAGRLAGAPPVPLVRAGPIKAGDGGPRRLGAGIGQAIFEGMIR